MSEVAILADEPQIEIENVAEPEAVESPGERLALLAGALANFQKASAELQDYQARAARAEADEETALSDHSLSELDALEKIQRAQGLKAVYASRIDHRKREVAKLITELEEACRRAEMEFTGLLNAEVQTRSNDLTAKVLEILDVAENAQSLIRIELAACIRRANKVRAIDELRPRSYLETGSGFYAERSATAILENFRLYTLEIAG